jgi:hypothetical protein
VHWRSAAGASHHGSASGSAGEATSNENACQGLRQRLRHLVALSFARPAPADDFKFGIGGGATFTSLDIIFGDGFKSGWTVTGRALWFPSGFFLGVRGAGYYGQTSPMTVYFLGVPVKNATLAGGDLNLAVRLVGKGADGLGYSSGWFFTEANVVYFKVQNSDFVSMPLAVGFQF